MNIISKQTTMRISTRALASLFSVTAAASVVLSSCSSASLFLLGGFGFGGDGIGFVEAFAFQGVVPSARRIGRARTAPVSAQRRVDGLLHVVHAAASAGDDGDNEVEVTIGQPIEDSADIIEVDENQVVVHPAAANAAGDGDAVSKASRIEGEEDEDADTTATCSSTASSSKASENEEPLVLEPVPPASHSLETSQNGPAGGTVTTLTVHLGAPGHPDPIVIQTGKVGRQAAGAVTLTRGDTVLYATAARDSQPKESIDFLPLSVEHQERFSSAGLTSGSYNKRDGRVSIECKFCECRCHVLHVYWKFLEWKARPHALTISQSLCSPSLC